MLGDFSAAAEGCRVLPTGPFDAILVLGNTLDHRFGRTGGCMRELFLAVAESARSGGRPGVRRFLDHFAGRS